MNDEIIIIEKPEWITWREIQQVLSSAHGENRRKGINMRKPSLSDKEIAQEIEGKGVMLIAVIGKKVVGTAAILFRKCSKWYNQGEYGYLCFAAVLPEYAGLGVYRRLCEERERIARGKGLKGLLFDTHHKNKHVISINRRNGFRRVAMKSCGDHWNVVMFKWLVNRPPLKLVCAFHFVYSGIILFLFRFKKRLLNSKKRVFGYLAS